jgi:hypothetical protein
MKSVCGVSNAWRPDVDFPYEKHETSCHLWSPGRIVDVQQILCQTLLKTCPDPFLTC